MGIFIDSQFLKSPYEFCFDSYIFMNQLKELALSIIISLLIDRKHFYERLFNKELGINT